MSHFVVMVTNTNEVPVEEQLEPFFEQGEEGEYFMEKEYWLKRDEKEVDEWLKNEIKSFGDRLPELEENSDRYEQTLECLKKLGEIRDEKDLDKKMERIKEWEGGGLDKDGLYWVYNPNAKWDWWVVGGRWNGWLVDKNGIKCNVCTVEDLDFEKMKEQEMEYARQSWNAEMERAREHGYAPSMFGWDKFPSREDYAKSFDKPSAPFAFLHDGEWVERGQMGWWGISDDKFTKEEWDKKFQEFIKGLDPETEITIVDCHI